MRSLAKIQHSFQNFLLGYESDINYFIKLPENTSASERLEIYAEGYFARLIEVLMEDFPKLLAYVGEQSFADMACAYIKAHPSNHFAVNNIGRKLSEFLLREDRYKERPVLSELAALDWLLTQAMDAINESILQREDLQNILQDAWPGIIFQLHSSFHLLSVRWNTILIWEAIRDNKKIPKEKKLEAKKYYSIWRFNLESYYSENSKEEDCVIQAIIQRKNFAEICEDLCRYVDEDDVANYVVNLILIWIEQGVLHAAK